MSRILWLSLLVLCGVLFVGLTVRALVARRFGRIEAGNLAVVFGMAMFAAPPALFESALADDMLVPSCGVALALCGAVTNAIGRREAARERSP